MQLLLDLPDISPELAKVVETNPKKLREWLIALPSSSVIETGRQIHDALASLNRIELAADERTQLLAEYESMLDMLAGSFEAAYAAGGLPLRDRARQSAMVYRNLWLEMAMGWKVALVSRLEKRSLFSGNGKADPLFVQRVLYSYWRFYRICCRLYMPLPAGIWSEIHQMFHLGIKNQFLDEPLEPKNRSIASMYKRILLFSLADPLRFSSQEQDKVVEIVENYGHLAHFLPLTKLTSRAGYFLTELDSDKPPRYVGNQAIDTGVTSGILLSTDDLSRYLYKTEAAIEAKAPQAHDRSRLLSRLEILRRVIRQWAISPQRTFQRISSHALVDIALGIDSVIRHLQGGEALLTLPIAPSVANIDVPASHMALSKWQILNESPGGFAVRAVSVAEEQVRPGDVVALRAVAEGPWLVASIRWMQSVESGIEIGLQVMSARAIPALIGSTVGGGASAYLLALMIPEIPALKQPARIAASKGAYTPLREYIVRDPAGEYRVRASKLAEQQMSYDLFEYQAISPEQPAT